jgi:hypothetical protein
MPPESPPPLRRWGFTAAFTAPDERAARPKAAPPPKPLVTVIAAVWCQQEDKEALLRGHMANLDRQSVAVERICVFDGGDAPPAWLTGTAVSVREPLTIYQAWNVALSLVQTPFVMNLNLDDRLATDAIELLLNGIKEDPEIFLIGGDWKICGSAEATDDIGRAYPIDRLPHTLLWPPETGVEARIGCGDGANTTSYGPACLWRTIAHLSVPRYPYRFTDGTLIKVIGDGVWWHLIDVHMGKKLGRLPLVIGNYRTWPASQAEFRNPGDEELKKIGYAFL